MLRDATSLPPDTNLEPTPPARPWLSRHLTNLLTLALLGAVLYLAYVEVEAARTALVSAFTMVVGLQVGARTALKVPGRDQ